MLNTLENLIKLARERKKNPIEGSYTNKLLSDKFLSKEKVLEEIHELIESFEHNSFGVIKIKHLLSVPIFILIRSLRCYSQSEISERKN